MNAISNIYKINIRGSILPWAGVYLAHINGQDQLARCDIILLRLWPKMIMAKNVPIVVSGSAKGLLI